MNHANVESRASSSCDADRRIFEANHKNLTENRVSPSFKRSGIFAYCILFFLGIGSMIPFFALVTAHAYFYNKFCDTSFTESFSTFISLFYNISQPFGLLYTIKYNNTLSVSAQVIYPLIVYTSLFVLTTVFVLTNDVKGNLLFGITLVISFLCGLSSAVMNGGLFGLTGTLPPITTSAIMAGQAFAGLLIALVNMLTTATNPDTSDCDSDDTSATNDTPDGGNNSNDDSTCANQNTVDYGAFSFFFISTLILATCIILYVLLTRLEYIRYHMYLQSLTPEGGINNDSSNNKETHRHRHEEEGIVNHIHSLMEAAERGKVNTISKNSSMDNSNNNSRSTSKAQENATVIMSLPTLSSRRPSESDDHDEDADVCTEQDGNRGNSIGRTSTTSRGSAGHNLNAHYTDEGAMTGGISAVYAFSHSNRNSLGDLSSVDAKQQTTGGGDPTLHITWTKVMLILTIIRSPAYSVFITFALSLSVYPGLLVLVQSDQACDSSDRIYNDLFIPLLFLLYPLGDFTGRLIAERFKSTSFVTAHNIYLPATARVLIILALFFCKIRGSRLPILFPYDGIVIVLVLILGFTNGYLANLGMMFGPTLVTAGNLLATAQRQREKKRQQQQQEGEKRAQLSSKIGNGGGANVVTAATARAAKADTAVCDDLTTISTTTTATLSDDMALAGTIMVFCLVFGLCVGSAFSFLFLFIVTGSVA